MNPRNAYNNQKYTAKRRGIEFRFSYESWVAWWLKNLGPEWMSLRGCRAGQYVMARYEDEGPYEEDNVECITNEENHRRYNKARAPSSGWTHPRLPKAIVLAIFADEARYDDILAKYGGFGLTKHKIYCIKTKRYYSKYTDELPG